VSGKLILLIALIFGALAPAVGAWAQQNRHDGPPREAPPRAMTRRDQAPYAAPRAYGGYPPPAAYGPPVYAGPYGGPARIAPPPYGYPTGVVQAPPGSSPPPDWRLQQEAARSGVRRGEFAPLGRVIADIREHTPGRQLDTSLEYQGGRAVYRVRWITARGRRVDFLVDAASGAILGER
jgi:hypothetical protein